MPIIYSLVSKQAAAARRLYLVRWELREAVEVSTALTEQQCSMVAAMAERCAAENGGWTTKRQKKRSLIDSMAVTSLAC